MRRLHRLFRYAKLKLKHQLTELGKAVIGSSPHDSALAEKRAAVTKVIEVIQTDELAVAELGTELKSNGQSKSIQRSILIGVAVVVLVSLVSWALRVFVLSPATRSIPQEDG